MSDLTIREAYRRASSLLLREGIEEANRHAELLIQQVLGWNRTQFLLRWDEPFPLELTTTFERYLQRRLSGEPLQYIVGEQEFYGLPFRVNRSVLIPRPETELLVEAVLQRGDELMTRTGMESLHVLDIGTGSGAIAVTLAVKRPAWRITASDISEDALQVAKQNAELNGVAGRIRWVCGDLLTPWLVDDSVIASNGIRDGGNDAVDKDVASSRGSAGVGEDVASSRGSVGFDEDVASGRGNDAVGEDVASGRGNDAVGEDVASSRGNNAVDEDVASIRGNDAVGEDVASSRGNDAVGEDVDSSLDSVGVDDEGAKDGQSESLFNIIVSNPPYIEEEEIERLQLEVRQYEPHTALNGGKDGLRIYARLVDQLEQLKQRRPSIVALEVGRGQDEAVSEMLADLREWDDISVVRDLAGIMRHVVAVRSKY